MRPARGRDRGEPVGRRVDGRDLRSLRAVRQRDRDRGSDAGRLHPFTAVFTPSATPTSSLEGRFLAAVKACGAPRSSATSRRPRSGASSSGTAAIPRSRCPGGHADATAGIRIHRTSALEAVTSAPKASRSRPRPERSSTSPQCCRTSRSAAPCARQRAQARHAAQLDRRDAAGPAAARPTSGGSSPPAPHPPAASSRTPCSTYRSRRLRAPDVNQPLDIDGRRVIPDFRWPEQRLVIEADGAEWHDYRVAREDDAERQALLEAHGERVMRVALGAGGPPPRSRPSPASQRRRGSA